MVIYIDTQYRCHKEAAPDRRPFDIPTLDGKVADYVEGFLYLPDGERTTLPSGAVVEGPYLTAIQPAAALAARQRGEEQRALALLGALGSAPPTVYAAATRRAVNAVLPVLGDADALQLKSLMEPWREDAAYAVGQYVLHEDACYRCLTAHTAQPGWAPGVAPSLWVSVDDPAAEWPLWRQPAGAPDVYPVGAKVSWQDRRWVSLSDANVWQPGVYGWQEVRA